MPTTRPLYFHKTLEPIPADPIFGAMKGQSRANGVWTFNETLAPLLVKTWLLSEEVPLPV